MHHETTPALMHEQPLPIRPCADGDRLHAAAAPRQPIPRSLVEMHAPKTPRTMIPMPRARSNE
jgi:hypothetical protein